MLICLLPRPRTPQAFAFVGHHDQRADAFA
jgi:hypothetical protein